MRLSILSVLITLSLCFSHCTGEDDDGEFTPEEQALACLISVLNCQNQDSQRRPACESSAVFIICLGGGP